MQVVMYITYHNIIKPFDADSPWFDNPMSIGKMAIPTKPIKLQKWYSLDIDYNDIKITKEYDSSTEESI